MAGKSTLLLIIGGKCLVAADAARAPVPARALLSGGAGAETCGVQVRVIGRPPFHDTALTCSGELSYLGSQWRRNVSFAGTSVPVSGDIGAHEMIWGVEGADPARRDRLVTLLGIDPSWRMNTVRAT